MSVALVNGTVIDGNGGPPTQQATVLIAGERIEAVGASSAVSIPSDAQRLDLGGKTIMPGLIDGHIHISGNFNSDPSSLVEGMSEYGAIQGVVAAQRLLNAGFTAARAMAPHTTGASYANVALKLAIDQGLVPGPRLISAGPMLRAVGDTWRWKPPAPYPTSPHAIFSGPSEARRAVRLQHAHGVDFVETMVSGVNGNSNGPTSVDTTTWTLKEMKEAVDQAHMLDHKISANCYSDDSVEMCVKAGFDVIEHGCLITERGIEALADAGTYVVPTLAPLRSFLATEAEKVYPKWMIDSGLRIERTIRETFPKYLSAGLKVFGGSDGSAPVIGRRPGEGAIELEIMVEYGMSPMEAIVANTRTAARAMGWEQEIGTLEKGKLADLIVVSDNPLANIGRLRDPENISLVMKGGAIHRSTLQPESSP